MEDIKILEDLINRLRNGISLGVVNEWNPNKTFAQAIENLINRNKELEELNSVKEIYYTQKEIETDYIPKSKLKEKIEELEEEKQCFYSDYAIEERNNKIQVLQELLEKE